MAKQGVSAARFRRVDVDEYDENKFVDEEEGGDGQAGPDEGEVDSCLRHFRLSREAEAVGDVNSAAPKPQKSTVVKKFSLNERNIMAI